MQIRFIPVSSRFEFVTGFVCEVVRLVGPRHNLSNEVIERIRSRVWGLWLRFAIIAARVRAGTAAVAVAVARARGRNGAARGVGKPRAPDLLPRERGWLLRWIPEADPQATDQMELMLKQPDLKLLIAMAPEVCGILRPMCHMLGISLPAILRLPRRARVRAVEVVSEPEPEPAEVPEPEPAEVPEPEPAEVAEPERRYEGAADQGCWPGWPGPCVVPRSNEEFWNFDFGKSDGLKNRD
jgi:hypothetical protein